MRVDHHPGSNGGTKSKVRFVHHVIEKRSRDQVCLLTIREMEVLLDPPDKFLDRYRILEREQSAKSAFVALGFAEKRDIHGA